MSKRTLDSFLLPPPSSSSYSANSKRTKRDPPNPRSAPKHAVVSKSSTRKSNGIEVVDLDKVIDLETPSPSPQLSASVIVLDGEEAGTSSLHAAGEENHEEEPRQGCKTLDTEKQQQTLNITAQPPSFDTPPPPPLQDTHINYPFPIPHLPPQISSSITSAPVKQPTTLTHLPHLDLLHFEPYLDAKTSREYGEFLRRELPFYRVEYKLTRFGKVTDIKTPRYTSVEIATGTTYNYALVNYYSTGSDSISYHSDDEHFLEKQPAIASFSFLGVRDFVMKHKPVPAASSKSTLPGVSSSSTTATASRTENDDDAPSLAEITKAATTPLKFSLRPGTLILMRGPTQSHWLHSIPKRAGDGAGGRINITFRRNMTPAGTENYYRYNVGVGVGGDGVWKWDERGERCGCVGRVGTVVSGGSSSLGEWALGFVLDVGAYQRLKVQPLARPHTSNAPPPYPSPRKQMSNAPPPALNTMRINKHRSSTRREEQVVGNPSPTAH
ncbi:hypothetical protein QFC21_004591 [Naganishia friedmannii]|uniref:Uncharacterized protein n=1 Tax=Naganishia friedmannii TaxID=89922 RepID=A0ACC2VH51_9TREE|nr:hypothetical protein QFC21_004591 [Naganishia friedmannii]